MGKDTSGGVCKDVFRDEEGSDPSIRCEQKAGVGALGQGPAGKKGVTRVCTGRVSLGPGPFYDSHPFPGYHEVSSSLYPTFSQLCDLLHPRHRAGSPG